MRSSRVMLAGAAGLSLVALSAAAAVSGGDDDGDDGFRTKLSGYEEVPSISSPARGKFEAEMDDDEISWRLRYRGFTTVVTQAHIHFGQVGVNGGVSAFLCSNLGNGPAGTPACPPSGEVSGTLTAASVIGPAGQGIAAGELGELLAAVDAEVAYVNVHTDVYPGGEIRGQLEEDD